MHNVQYLHVHFKSSNDDDNDDYDEEKIPLVWMPCSWSGANSDMASTDFFVVDAEGSQCRLIDDVIQMPPRKKQSLPPNTNWFGHPITFGESFSQSCPETSKASQTLRTCKTGTPIHVTQLQGRYSLRFSLLEYKKKTTGGRRECFDSCIVENCSCVTWIGVKVW